MMRHRLAFYISILFTAAILDALQRLDPEAFCDLRNFFRGWLINLIYLYFGGYDE